MPIGVKMKNGIGNQSLLLATIKDKLLVPPSKFVWLGYNIAYSLGLTPISYHMQNYEAKEKNGVDGWTVTVYLAESHVIFESYAEHGTYDIEIASCRRINVEDFIQAMATAGIKKKNIKGALALQKQGYKWA